MEMFNIWLPVAEVEFNALLLILIGFCVGVLGGFFGVGGAWIVTPALNIFGFSMPFAIGTDLAHIFGKSIIATKKHSKMGNVDWKLGLICVIGSVIGIEIGAQTIMFLEKVADVGSIVRWTYICLLFSLAAFMFHDYFYVRPQQLMENTFPEGPDAKGKKRQHKKTLAQKLQSLQWPPMVSFPISGIKSVSVWIIIIIFIFTGFLAGFLGVGGGFIRMPALVYLIGCPTVIAVGTDLFEVLISAGYGCFTYAIKGRVELVAALVMLTGASIGAQIGVTAVKYIKGYGIRLLFAVMVLLAGISVVLKQLNSIFKISFFQSASQIVILGAAVTMTSIICIRLFIEARKEKKLSA